ncbi:MAG: hypothetical protein DRO23_08560 [Thermoprotei archaeon]|nr:MAG: hypothetical protein DRO23_08560 [Thermoprotei archaeon]
MTELFINVSNIISPLCYSIMRIEPYTSCNFNCTYCYARWYREQGVPQPKYNVLHDFLKIAKTIHKKQLKPLPIRLSTLVEPFQPIEYDEKISLKVLEIAYRYNYPVIVNTKSTLLIRKPWLSMLVDMADRGLVVVQYSFSTFEEKYHKVLEPKAPTPEERVEAAGFLSDEGVPMVFRISPYIPEITNSIGFKAIAKIAKECRVKHVIVESIRLTEKEFSKVYSVLGLSVPPLEKYSLRGEGELLRLSLEMRLRHYMQMVRELKTYNIGFATCKEGFYNLHSVSDCCGFYLFNKPAAKRITLYEYFLEAQTRDIELNLIEEIHSKLCKKHNALCSHSVREYPRTMKEPLKYHEKRLLKILKDPKTLLKVAPVFTIYRDKLRVKHVV